MPWPSGFNSIEGSLSKTSISSALGAATLSAR
jgi:hypothetical protein